MKAVDITKEQEIEGFWDIEYEFDGEIVHKKNCYGKIFIKKDSHYIELVVKLANFWMFEIYYSSIIIKFFHGVSDLGFIKLYNCTFLRLSGGNEICNLLFSFEYAFSSQGKFDYQLDEDIHLNFPRGRILIDNIDSFLSNELKKEIREKLSNCSSELSLPINMVKLDEIEIIFNIIFLKKKKTVTNTEILLEIEYRGFKSLEESINIIKKIHTILHILFNCNSIVFKTIEIRMQDKSNPRIIFLSFLNYSQYVINIKVLKQLLWIDRINFINYFEHHLIQYQKIPDYYNKYFILASSNKFSEKVVLLIQLLDSSILHFGFIDNPKKLTKEDKEKFLTFINKNNFSDELYSYICAYNTKPSLKNKLQKCYKILSTLYGNSPFNNAEKIINYFYEIRNSMSHGEFEKKNIILKNKYEIDDITCYNAVLFFQFGLYILSFKSDNFELEQYRDTFIQLFESNKK